MFHSLNSRIIELKQIFSNFVLCVSLIFKFSYPLNRTFYVLKIGANRHISYNVTGAEEKIHSLEAVFAAKKQLYKRRPVAYFEKVTFGGKRR